MESYVDGKTETELPYRRPTRREKIEQSVQSASDAYLEKKGVPKGSEFVVTRTDKNVDSGTGADGTAERAIYPVGIVFLAAWYIGTSIVGFIGALFTDGFWLVMGSLITLFGYLVNQEWRGALADLDSGDDDKVDDALKFFNHNVAVNNAIMTVSLWAITVWDLVVGFRWLLYQIIVDVVIIVFKFVIGVPELRIFFINAVQIGIILFRILCQVLAGLLMALQAEGVFGTGGVGSGASTAPSGSSSDSSDADVYADQRNFIIVGAQLVSESVAIIIRVFGGFYLIYLRFWFDVFIKVIPVVMQAAMFLLELLDPSQPLGMAIFWLLNFNLSVVNFLANNCFTQKAMATVGCWQSAIVAGGYNHVVKVVNKLVVGGNPLKKITGCNPNKLDFSCKDPPKNPFTSGGFPSFGAGLCNEEECAVDVVGILTEFESLGRDCTFWVDEDAATPFCFDVVDQYALFNSSSMASASIDTLASELCFVIREKVLSQCVIPAPPFSFDFNATANEVCVDDLSGDPQPFNDVCACTFENPLCDMSCCEQYARHVNGQVIEQIGDRTCDDMRNQFTEFGIWCPVNESTPLTDLTFAHVWCNYYRLVLDPLCPINSLLLIKDLDFPAVLPPYISNTCTRTVDKEGVCQPVDTALSFLTSDVIRDSVDIDPEELFEEARDTEWVPGPITTIPPPGADAMTLLVTNVQKHACWELSEFRNSSNPLWTSQPWSINHFVVTKCDQVVAAAIAAPSVQQAPVVQEGRRNVNGVFLPTDLEGVPPNEPPFFGAVPNSAGELCDFGIGQTEVEISDQQRCASESQDQMNRNADSLGEEGVDSLMLLEENGQRTMETKYLSELAPPSPDDPDFDRKMTDIEVMRAAQNTPTNFNTPNAAELDPTVRDPYKNPYKVKPPPDGSFFQYDPFSVTVKTKPGGRATLSIEPDAESRRRGSPRRKILQQEKEKRRALRFLQTFGDRVVADVEMRRDKIENDKEALEAERAYAEDMKARMLENLEYARDNLPYLLYGDNPPRAYTSTGKEGGRQLLQIDEVKLTQSIQDLMDAVHTMPTSLGTITQENFNVYLAQSALERFDYVAELTLNIIIPKIYNLYYGPMNMTNTSSSDSGPAFGGTDGQFDPNCRATVNDPYRCCTADADAYECCGRLFGCIPLPADSLFLDSVTPENIDDWRCKPYASFFNEWKQALRLIFNTPVRELEKRAGSSADVVRFFFGWLKWPGNEAPPNQLPCHWFNFFYIPFGIILARLVYIFLTVNQVATLIIASQIFINQEGDRARRDAAKSNAIYD